MQPYDLVSTLMPDTAEIYALHEETEEEQPQACRLKYTCMCVYEFICKHTHTHAHAHQYISKDRQGSQRVQPSTKLRL